MTATRKGMSGPTQSQLVQMYTNLVRVRKVDEFLCDAALGGRLAAPFFHSQQGQEAIGVGACTFLRPTDYVWYTHRGHGACEVIAKGLSVDSIVAEHLGKVTGSCRGFGFINTCAPEIGIFGMGGTVGGESTLAAGTALAAKLRGEGQVTLCFLGDGAFGEGSVHTALLMSANWRLPIVWVCSNNRMGMWVPLSAAYPKEDVSDLAFGYDLPVTIQDGQDVGTVYETVQAAVERARAGEGPSFLEFKTCRFRPQAEGLEDYSLEGVRDPVEVAEWMERDPIKLCGDRLLQDGILTEGDLARIDLEATAEVERAEQAANNSPYPEPALLAEALYAE